MGTAKDFRVKKGLVVEDGDVTLASDHTVNAGTFDTNVAAAGVTLTGTTLAADGTDANINIAITPKGTGEVDISKVDIAGGAIDGTTIGAASASTGAFTTLSATGAVTATNTVTVGVDDTGHDVKFFGATSGKYMLWDESADQMKIIGTASTVALDVDTGDFTVGAYGLTNAGAATIASMAGNWTNAGRTVADLGTITTVDINGGSIDGTTIGANSAAAGTFAAIVGTTIDATTDFTVGSTVITDDSIVMTPSTNDTVTMAASGNGAFELTTVDTASTDSNTDANIQINCGGQFRQYWMANEQMIFGTTTYADGTGSEITGQNLLSIIGDTTTGDGNASGGQMSPTANNVFDLGSDSKEYKNVWVDGLVTSGAGVHLGYGTNSKLNTISGGVEVTGTLDATSTVYGGGFKSSAEQSSAGTGVDLDSSATFRAKEDGGVYSHADVIAGGGAKVTTENMENTNFRTSRLVTETGTIAAGTLTTLLYINLDNTSNNKYHAVEVECAFQEKITSTNVRTRWLSQKLYACYDGNEVHFRTDNTRFKNTLNNYAPGEFCAGLWNDGQDKYLTISATLYEAKSSTDRTATFSINANALSMPVALNE